MLGSSAADFSERTHKVSFGVSRGGGPAVDGDEDLLGEKCGCLAGSQTDAGKEARDGGSKDGLDGERVGTGAGQGRVVNMADVRAPVALDDADDFAGGLFLGGGGVAEEFGFLQVFVVGHVFFLFRFLSVVVFEGRFLVNDLVCGGLPLGLGKDVDNDNVAMDGSVHVFAADEEDGFGEGGDVDGALGNGR